MAVLNELKKQIVSTRSISKITKAMELVSTAKLKRVGQHISVLKPYFAEIYTMFNEIIREAEKLDFDANKVPIDHKSVTGWVIINSNLGLCGGYNINLNKLALKNLNSNDYIILVGQKGQGFYENHKIKIAEHIKNVNISYSYEDARDIGSELISLFNNKKIDKIKIAYTKFINNVTFEPTILQLLPIAKQPGEEQKPKSSWIITEFNPNPAEVLKTAIPFYINSIIYSCVIESQVSEQASRRNAMENATKNANEMIDDLSLQYNRKRQGAITQEILEIISGANAQKDE